MVKMIRYGNLAHVLRYQL